MNLDKELRAVLSQEAEMTNVTKPDVDGVVSGGQARRRRRNLTRLGGAAAAVVLVGGGVYGATQLGDGEAKTDPGIVDEPTTDPSDAAEPPPYLDLDGASLEPGTYRMSVGTDQSGEIAADVTFGQGWESSGLPKVWRDDTDWAAIAILQVSALPGESGCVIYDGTDFAATWEAPGRRAAVTTHGLARQLEQLPGGAVVTSPEPTEAFGYPARHLQVRIHDRCGPKDVYVVAKTADGERHGISYYDDLPVPDREVLVDFLVVDVDGSPVVVALVRHVDTTQDTLAEVTSARDSITFVTEE